MPTIISTTGNPRLATIRIVYLLGEVENITSIILSQRFQNIYYLPNRGNGSIDLPFLLISKYGLAPVAVRLSTNQTKVFLPFQRTTISL
jgi:hypothetical protein